MFALFALFLCWLAQEPAPAALEAVLAQAAQECPFK